MKSEGDTEENIGHVRDSFVKVLQPFMRNGVVIRLNGKIIGRDIRAPEGTSTQGGGIQIPSKYKIYCGSKHKEIVKSKLKN